MASSVTQICNRALQKLGASRIVTITENSRNARSCNAAYQSCLDSELRLHTWNFAIKRVILASDVTAPIFGFGSAFTLPADFLRLLAPDPQFNYLFLDWQIEGSKLLSNDTGPLNVRYIGQVSDPNLMDPAFREVLACRIAVELCEEITQSNSKIATCGQGYNMAIKEAKKANAMENQPVESTDDTWLAARGSWGGTGPGNGGGGWWNY